MPLVPILLSLGEREQKLLLKDLFLFFSCFDLAGVQLDRDNCLHSRLYTIGEVVSTGWSEFTRNSKNFFVILPPLPPPRQQHQCAESGQQPIGVTVYTRMALKTVKISGAINSKKSMGS